MSKKSKDGNVLKCDMIWIIQNYIRGSDWQCKRRIFKGFFILYCKKTC